MGKKSSKKKAPVKKAQAAKEAAGKKPPKKSPPKSVKPVRAGSQKKPQKPAANGVVSEGTLRILDQITYLTLHAVVIVVPWAFGQYTFDQFDMPKVVTLRFITLLMIATWSARFLLSRKTEIRRTPMDWFILAFLVWVTLSTIFSVHLPTALLGKYRRYEGYISLVNYAVVFFVAVQTLRSYGRLRALAKSMVIVGGAIGVYGIGQYLGYDVLQWGQLPFDQFRAFAAYGNPDLLVGYFAVLVPIGIGLFMTTEDDYEAAAYGLCTVLIFAGLLVTFSRSAWVGLFVALPYMAVVLWRQGMFAKRRTRVIAIAACMGLILVGLVGYSVRSTNSVTNIAARFVSIFNPSEGSAGTRWEIWKSAAEATKEKPVLGFGPDTFRLIFPRYKTVRYVQMAGYRSVADNAHSYPFQLAPAIGIPGVILFYLLVFFGFGRMVGITVKRGEHDLERVTIASFGAGAMAYGVHLLFGLSVTGTTIFLWICFAAYMLPFAKAKPIEWRSASAAIRVAALAAVLVAVVAGTVLNYRFLVADMWHLRSYQWQDSDKNAAIQAVDTALALNPYWDAYRAQKVMLLMDKAASGGDREDLKTAIAAARESIVQTPREYDNYLFLANAYAQASRVFQDRRYLASTPDSPYATRDYNVDQAGKDLPATALDVSLYALRNVEPNAPSAMVQAALAYGDLGALDKAVPLLEKAVYEDPSYAEAFYYLGTMYEKTAEKKKALDAYEKAVVAREQRATPGQDSAFPEASSAAARLRKELR
ncbi:MAG: hypothetical protein C4521_12600 [Actinobacteria bacterium]|nr:MAG: hypothetical protein C4521_12600 [Actinomycetota bacterium]